LTVSVELAIGWLKKFIGSARAPNPERLAMGRFAKSLATAAVGIIGLLGGSFEIWAEGTASTSSRSQASCNDDEVRKGLIRFARLNLGTNDAALGDPHISGEYCVILLSADSSRELGYIRYSAAGYKWFPVIWFYDWPGKWFFRGVHISRLPFFGYISGCASGIGIYLPCPGLDDTGRRSDLGTVVYG
jgi:hypothetical protein